MPRRAGGFEPNAIPSHLALSSHLALPPRGRMCRLGVTGEGVDPRLVQACAAVCEELGRRRGGQQVLQPQALLARRCEQLLRDLPTSLEEDEALAEGVDHSTPLGVALAFRMRRKRLLAHVMQRLAG